jgi:uncharacterized RDD family membrane protein YckC
MEGQEVLYARFPRRFWALTIDSLVYAGVAIVVVALAVILRPPQAVRLSLFGFLIAFILLYEPLLVSLYGGTIGHRATNLRVLATTSSGRLPLWQAFLRSLLKLLTGIAAFVVMPLTRRNQALHDLPFGSTVVLRDPRRAQDHEFIRERPPAPARALPGRLRRLLAVLVYAIGVWFLTGVAAYLLESTDCVSGGACGAADKAINTLVGLGWLAGTALVIVLGVQGRLPGARGRLIRAATTPP